MRRRQLIMWLTAALALGACGAVRAPDVAAPALSTSTTSASPSIGSTPNATTAVVEPMDDQAVEAEPATEPTVATDDDSGADSDSVATVKESPDGAVPVAYLDAVVADAARRAGVAASAVEVVEAYPVDWPDASLGCPEPGMSYAQVITPGYRIVLDAGDGRFDYRLTAAGGFKLCDQGDGLYVPDPPDKSGTVPLPPPPSDS